MGKKSGFLTAQNLAQLGVVDSFYQLYSSCKEIVSECQKIETEAKEFLPNETKQELVGKALRKLYNNFFEEYSYLFSEAPIRLHVNSFFLKQTIDHIEKINISVTHKDHKIMMQYILGFNYFNQYLHLFEADVACLLSNYYAKKKISFLNEDWYYKKIDERILDLVSTAQEKIFTTNDNRVGPICSKIILYKNLKTISCNLKGHDVVADYSFFTAADGSLVHLPVHHCLTCNKWFIGEESLKLFEKEYGKFFVIKESDSTSLESLFYCSGISKLYQTGYNARGDGMPETYRHQFLKNLIITKQMTPFEIIRDLEGAIRLHENNYASFNAVEKWKCDLKFVNNLWSELV